MILLLDTSTSLCHLWLGRDADSLIYSQWQAERNLADGLLKFMSDALHQQNSTLHDITAIAIVTGPGSFTGLRIGITVCNTLADSMNVPIIGATKSKDSDIVDRQWLINAMNRLENGENDRIVMPMYGSDAHITAPKK